MEPKRPRSAIAAGRQIDSLKVHSLILGRWRTLKSADLGVLAQGPEQHRRPTPMQSTYKNITVLIYGVLFHLSLFKLRRGGFLPGAGVATGSLFRSPTEPINS